MQETHGHVLGLGTIQSCRKLLGEHPKNAGDTWTCIKVRHYSIMLEVTGRQDKGRTRARQGEDKGRTRGGQWEVKGRTRCLKLKIANKMKSNSTSKQ